MSHPSRGSQCHSGYLIYMVGKVSPQGTYSFSSAFFQVTHVIFFEIGRITFEKLIFVFFYLFKQYSFSTFTPRATNCSSRELTSLQLLLNFFKSNTVERKEKEEKRNQNKREISKFAKKNDLIGR